MRADPLVSVIILNYNGKKFLEVLIPSLLRQTFTFFETIVVDTGSTDDSLQFLSQYSRSIMTLSCSINSFSAGNNAGIRKSRGKYVLTLNNDVELQEDFLQKLVAVAEKSSSGVGMWASKILNYYERATIDSAGLAMYGDGISRGRGRMQKDDGRFDAEEEVFFPSGCAGLYRKVMLDAIGLFDEDFEFFLEDSDLGLRGRLAGWKCIYVPEARVYHMYSSTIGKYSARKAFLVERNRVWLVAKLFSPSLIFLSFLYTGLRYGYQVYGVFSKKGSAAKLADNVSKMSVVGIVLKAWFFALLGLPRMFKKRKTLSNYTRITHGQRVDLLKRFSMSAHELSLAE